MVKEAKPYENVDPVELHKETYDLTPASPPAQSKAEFLGHVQRNLPIKMRIKRNKPEHPGATFLYGLWMEDFNINKTEVRK